MSPEEQLQRMRARAEKFIGGEDVLKRLKEGRRLRVKLGVDPTRPDLTFGHMVCLNKLRELQDLGHTAVLLIGDFTTRVGDPTGRSSTRPVRFRPPAGRHVSRSTRPHPCPSRGSGS